MINWVILKSARKGLLENAQDGIFLTPRKPRKSINKSGNSFGGHSVFSHIFKIKDKKQIEILDILRNLLKCLGLIYENVLVLEKIWHIF